MHKDHFFLNNQFAVKHDFTPRTSGGSKKTKIERDRSGHASFLNRQYVQAIEFSFAELNSWQAQERPVADGVYLNLNIEGKAIPKSLDSKNGVQVINVLSRNEEDNVDVTVYVKEKNKTWFSKKLEDYATKDTEYDKPANAALVEPINDVSPASIHSLYIPEGEFDKLHEEENLLFELWVNKREEYELGKVFGVLEALDIGCQKENCLHFESVDVFLIKATKSQLQELPLSLGYIESIRMYHQPSLLTFNREANREWSALLKESVNFVHDDNSVSVGILDTGVNNEHQLLSSSLPNERMACAIGGLDNIDHSHHGTDMAGLVLCGDLSSLVYLRGALEDVHHKLCSVKIYEDNHQTDSMFYGAVIEDAIIKAQEMGASIDCMAITDAITYDSKPTSSSAALDESIYDDGKCDRLVVVSAGNIETADIDETNYIESCKANAIKSPAQAWNAITVGAFTNKTIVGDRRYNYTALAAPGAVSPLSRSSWRWQNGINKPDIVMEGGNVGYSNVMGSSTVTDLSLITTNQDLDEPLESFQATSASTALAARLAAKIKTANPALSLLSVRALMVHSAKWTKEMDSLEKSDRMSLCGYGVPNEEVASFSSEKCATYIFENVLIPFKQNGSEAPSYNEMHVYDLPWPNKLLESMHDEKVTMRVTLSYYVKPAPGTAGKQNKYRYPSASLHFDVKTSTETTAEFLRRRNKLEEGDVTSSNDSKRWTVGQMRRENSTVQSNWFTCTAQELSECGQIVVFPGSGWWKERKLSNVDNEIKYSLVVSIKTDKTEIYQAVETAIKAKVGIQVK